MWAEWCGGEDTAHALSTNPLAIRKGMAFDRVTRHALPQSTVTHLHLLRHGAVDTGGRRRAYGVTDAPLSSEGLRQAEALIDYAADSLPRPDGILSSDLSRCTAIAEPLAARLGVPLVTTPLLREQDMGAWEWKSWEELTVADEQAVHAYWSDYLNTAPTGGESFAEMGSRIAGWWQSQREALWGRRWVVVGHIGVIRSMLCLLFEHPLDQALRFAPMPGTHTHILVADSGAVLQVLGERPGGDSASKAVVHTARPVATERPPRLALSGSAGVGKTTLGRALAERYSVPYIPEGMRRRLEGGLNLHTLTHADLAALIVDLWQEQQQAEEHAMARHGGFIADRSSVDYAAFWLHYRFTNDQAATEEFFARTLSRISTYDRIVLLPWGVLPLEADGIRSSNPWLQRHYQAAVEGLLHREVEPDRLLVMPDIVGLERRLSVISAALE